MGDVTRDVRDEMFPYGVDTIRLRISFPPAPAPQGYNGRAWKMRPLRGWTGGAEWDAREAAAAAAAQGGGSDTAEMPRGQASEGGLARDVRFAPGVQSSQGELSEENVSQQAALGSHGDAGFRFERLQDPVEQSLAALAAAYPLPGDQRFAANTPRNTATDVSGAPQRDQAWMDSANRNPEQFVGKSAQEIADEFTAHGWPSRVEQSTQGSQRALIVRVPKGTRVGMVEVHPGGGRHGGAYTQVSTDHGTYKYVDPSTYVRTGPESGKTKFYDAKTFKPIDPNSLPMRGRASPVETTQPSPAASPGRSSNGNIGEPSPIPLESNGPGVIRPPPFEHGGGSSGGVPRLMSPVNPEKPDPEE